MKKILLVSAMALVVSSSTYASGNNFYIKGQIGVNKLNNTTANTQKGAASMKPENNMLIGAGIGCHLLENVRVDLTFDHYTDPKYKGDTASKNGVRYKTSVKTFMANGFIDLFDISIAKIFVGAGVGISVLSTKTTLALAGKTINDKTSKKNNIAYAMYVGSSVKFAPSIHGELTYSYRDLGRLKKSIMGYSLGEIKGHHLTAGIRFDI